MLCVHQPPAYYNLQWTQSPGPVQPTAHRPTDYAAHLFAFQRHLIGETANQVAHQPTRVSTTATRRNRQDAPATYPPSWVKKMLSLFAQQPPWAARVGDEKRLSFGSEKISC